MFEILPKFTVEEARIKFLEILQNTPRFPTNFSKWIIESTDFMSAPASSGSDNHCSFEGGLLIHSMNVYRRLCQFNELYKIEIPDDSLKVMGLFHDLCKIHFYEKSKRNVKNNKTGQWESVDYYIINDKMPLDHGHKSVILLRSLSLSKEEMYAIAWHLGAWDVQEFGRKCALREATKISPWVFALQVADQLATFYDE